MNRVTLYTKPDCHLCEAVEQVIASDAKPFELEVRNILDDADDFVKYQYEVPVVLVNEREVSRYRLTTTQLEAAGQWRRCYGEHRLPK
jgi:glutaredoxin